jgi:SAM-dependent methyltransferase
MRVPRLPVLPRERFLLERTPDRSRVLHVGCSCWPATEKEIAEGRLLHAHLSAKSIVMGIDISQPGLSALRAAGFDNVMQFDAMDLSAFPHRNFDVVVASDVIEHVANPGDLLRGIKTVLRPDGRLLLSTVNAFSLETYVKLAFGWESVHPEHVSYYSYTTLMEMASRFGYELEDAAYYYGVGWRGPFSSFAHRVSYTAMRLATIAVPHYATGLMFSLRARATA